MLIWVLTFNFWLLLAGDTPADTPWWVWILPVVFLFFMLVGLWIRSQGKGSVKPEKDMIGAAAEPKSQPRPRP
jgi:hypothetical protein